jgi:glycine betaine/proline transport system permease protein
MSFLNQIPTMDRDSLRELKKGIDLSFRDFSRAYGETIEGFFDPLLTFLILLYVLLNRTRCLNGFDNSIY